jgi:hypothetical protein
MVLAVGGLAVAPACGSDSTSPPAVTATVDLQPGAYSVLAGGAIAGAVEFPAAGAGGAAHLVVGQLASGLSDVSGTLRLGGASVAAGASPFAPSLLGQRTADRFHAMLRRREAEAGRTLSLNPFLRTAPRAPQVPPQVGDARTFKVCGNLDCSSLVNVAATAQWVGQHAALFVDDSVPANGLGPVDLAEIGTQFDTVLYPINVDRFGAESDIDGNSVVIVLLTDAVNRLIGKPDCEDAFVTGYFFGADIAPGFAPRYNSGEVFYGFVPDPTGAVECDYTTDLVKRLLPVTFIHEFQHMISFNQKVLVRGAPSEVLWLNEAMSHVAEELGSLHYDSLGDQTMRSRFQIGNLYNAFRYLREPHEHNLLTDVATGTLEERGAGWLFARWLLDRYGDLRTRDLVQTPLVDVAAVRAAAGGVPIESLLARWAMALYVSDLPGFTPPANVPYTSWRFRTTYASLNRQAPANFPVAFPLTPDSGLGGTVLQSGNLKAGSAAYVLPQQAAGGPSFALTFRAAGAPASSGPQLTVLRLR